MNCENCKKLTGGLCEKCLKEQDDNFMNQTNNRIRDEIEEEFIEILEYGKNLKGEEVWTDLEMMQWLRKKIDELLKSQREELVKKIEKHQNFITMSDYDVGYNDCKENIINLIKNN